MNPDVIWGGILGTLGTLLLYLVQRWLTAPDRKAKAEQAKIALQAKTEQAKVEQKQAIDEANIKLANELRAELRRDNEELRNRQRETEKILATTQGRLEDVLKTNATLHQDNLTLTEKNGVLTERTEAQAAQIKKLTETVQSQGAQIVELQADNITLINAMRTAGIPIPPLTADKKPGTGPLGKGA